MNKQQWIFFENTRYSDFFFDASNSVNHITLHYFYFYLQVMHLVEYHISISNSIYSIWAFSFSAEFVHILLG